MLHLRTQTTIQNTKLSTASLWWVVFSYLYIKLFWFLLIDVFSAFMICKDRSIIMLLHVQYINTHNTFISDIAHWTQHITQRDTSVWNFSERLTMHSSLYIWSDHVFSGNQIHDNGIANRLIITSCYRNIIDAHNQYNIINDKLQWIETHTKTNDLPKPKTAWVHRLKR